MSSPNGSRVFGMVLTLGLVGMALMFLFGMGEEARFGHDPTPVFGIAAAAVIFGILFRGPVGRAIAKMLEGADVHDDQLAARVEQLEGQVHDLNYEQQRMAELEERLDFAERLLSQRDPQMLPPVERP